MIILRNKLFTQRKYGPVIPRTPNTYHHYTTPQSAIRIAKTGLGFRQDKRAGISTYQGIGDILVGKDFNKLNEYTLGATKKIRGERASLQKLQGILKTESPVNPAEEHLKNHGVTSHLFYPSRYTGGTGKPGNPTVTYSNIDGLHTKASNMDDFTSGYTVMFRKTRNPVRAVINGSGIDVSKGTDIGEMKLNPVGGMVPKSRIKYEIPTSGVGTRDTDIKHLRRYFKGHKGLVNPTRETMEALYGSKWPHLNKFKSEMEI